MKLVLSDRPLTLSDSLDADTQYFDLSSCRIAHCVGCFGCWTKTPGRCVIRNDAVKIYPVITKSERVLYVSRVKYGGYDSPMKTMLERAIPVQQAFIRVLDGETHHVQHAAEPKRAVILAYGATSDEEREVFRALVARNAKNMNFLSYEIRFVTEDEVEQAAAQEVRAWQAS